ncbi:hypothetical protein PACTADRAFT_33752 [Pachysolen tannophilus NRRL Y-2460]|uniref:GDS1 winged helix domain-containing protein n=1 Tax=Pachysolen tannophilus NRRL Y-2460 TaxID=669874 RepID=A0A1E4TTW1_PACTA|nr:hypothetical protein PACTADRAFT_33752 [Pachysolen tannophilus NRRL Y-2460]
MALANSRPVGFPDPTLSPDLHQLDLAASPSSSPSSRFERSVSPSSTTSSFSSASTAATSVTGISNDLGADPDRKSSIATVTSGINAVTINSVSTPQSQQDGGNITPESIVSSNNGNGNGNKEKKKKDPSAKKNPNKVSSRISSATGISSAVPVTGERPRPTAHPTMDDDVFFAIFQILYDHDSEAKGMTVKQICDVLAEKHPEMDKLSTKTSNLVSAKLNAYVKRVEKGEKEVIYALSRDWADASPKRMVYVYRGLLTPDYYITARAMWQKLEAEGNLFPDRSKEEEKKAKKVEKKAAAAAAAAAAASSSGSSASPVSNSSLAASSSSVTSTGSTLSNSNYKGTGSITGIDMNVDIKNSLDISSFSDGSLDLRLPTLSIPYSVAPVTASLGSALNLVKEKDGDSLNAELPLIAKSNHMTTSHPSSSSSSSSSSYYTRRMFTHPKTKDEFELDEIDTFYDDEFGDIDFARLSQRDNKRSKSMSFLPNKKARYITAAAAAPRIERRISATSPKMAAAAAALREAAIKALSPAESGVSSHGRSLSIFSVSSVDSEPAVSAKWLKTIRSGFLTQDISMPEEVTLDELDSLFQ